MQVMQQAAAEPAHEAAAQSGPQQCIIPAGDASGALPAHILDPRHCRQGPETGWVWWGTPTCNSMTEFADDIFEAGSLKESCEQCLQ